MAIGNRTGRVMAAVALAVVAAACSDSGTTASAGFTSTADASTGGTTDGLAGSDGAADLAVADLGDALSAADVELSPLTDGNSAADVELSPPTDGNSAAEVELSPLTDGNSAADLASAADAMPETAASGDTTTALPGDTTNDSADTISTLAGCTTTTDCGNDLPCQVAVCTQKSQCTYVAKADLAPCSDGNACTGGDGCALGTCMGGKPLECNDDSPCTVDTCNPIGGCLNLAVKATTTCDDGDACTVGDSCLGKQCSAGTNTCQCKKTSDCGKFEDGDLCNGTLYCDTGSAPPYLCKPNPASVVVCSSTANNACQTNTCIAAKGSCELVLAPVNTTCDDGVKCTTGEVCVQGSCQGGTNTCFCAKNSDCDGQEDGDKCNGTLFCNKAKAICQLNPATVVTCATVDDSACRQNLCNPKEGKCHLVAVHSGDACDDGNACSANEKCATGQCTSTVNSCQCQKDADCAAKEDGDLCNGTLFCDQKTKMCVVNPATVVQCADAFDEYCLTSQCDKAVGKCSLQPALQGNTCTDGGVCSGGGWCAMGLCAIEVTTACECQQDSDCGKLEDGDLCNGTLYCDKAESKPASKPASKPLCKLNAATVVACPTVNDTACSKTSCVGLTGKCQAFAVNGACDDGKICTEQDACLSGSCSGVAKSCADSEVCTDDSCKEPYGCQQLPNAVTVCDDGNGCTVLDACIGGQCTGKKKPCDDANVCTTDACLPDTGCLFAPTLGPCTDGDACTLFDLCALAACKPGVAKVCIDGNACTQDGCDVGSGVCTVLDISAQKCDDSNPCTSDGCALSLGCTHTDNSAKCSDGNACTSGDMCGLGACTPGAATVCDDGKACTDNSCDAKKGCEFVNNSGPCDDGSACTFGDTCGNGSCTGSVKTCDDKNPCTEDSCSPKGSGCVFAPNSSSCNDNNLCTQFDACAFGSCTGNPLSCDDGNDCTADSCAPDKGCSSMDAVGPCSLPNCLADNTCSGSKCIAGSKGKLFDVALPMSSAVVSSATYGGSLAVGPLGEYLVIGTLTLSNSNTVGVVWINDALGADKSKVETGTSASSAANVAGQLYGCHVAGQTQWISPITAAGGFSGVNQTASNAAAIGEFKGGPVVVGRIAANGQVGYLVRAYAANLKTFWQYSIWGTVEETLAGVLAAKDQNQLVAVGTTGIKSHGGADAVIVRLTPTGELIGEHPFGGAAHDYANGIAHAAGDGFVVAGTTYSFGAGGSDGWLLRIDSNGKLLWQRTFGTSKVDGFTAIAAHGTGHVLAGYTYNDANASQDGWLVGVDRHGHIQWQRTVGGAGAQSVSALQILGDSSLVGVTQDAKSRLFRRDAFGFSSCGEAGLCAGLLPMACDDGNPCSVDTCAPIVGCTHVAADVGAVCSDSKTCDSEGKCTVPIGMRAIAAGPFWMGCAASDLGCSADEKPGRVVSLSAFAIDTLEVTYDDYLPCVLAGACPIPPVVNTQPQSTANYGLAVRGLHPLNHVSKSAAMAYCGWRNKRLPTEAEWERASRPSCQGLDAQACAQAAGIYPWGNVQADCLRAHFETTATGCGSKLTATSGGRPNGQSPAGVQDLAGNVAEWVSDGYDPEFYSNAPSSNPAAPVGTSLSVVRGGGFASKAGAVRASVRKAVGGAVGAEDTGFRCAQ